jgi:hypothetical protein
VQVGKGEVRSSGDSVPHGLRVVEEVGVEGVGGGSDVNRTQLHICWSGGSSRSNESISGRVVCRCV